MAEDFPQMPENVADLTALWDGRPAPFEAEFAEDETEASDSTYVDQLLPDAGGILPFDKDAAPTAAERIARARRHLAEEAKLRNEAQPGGDDEG